MSLIKAKLNKSKYMLEGELDKVYFRQRAERYYTFTPCIEMFRAFWHKPIMQEFYVTVKSAGNYRRLQTLG